MAKNPLPDHSKFAADPDVPLGEELGRLAQRRLKQIAKSVKGVKAGDIESVHDMRTATRRLRAMIRLRRDHSPGNGLKPVAKGARSLGRKLGLVRADDVLILGLRNLESNNAIRAIELAAVIRRADHSRSLTKFIESDRFADWLDFAKEELCDRNEMQMTAGDIAPSSIEKAFDPVFAHAGISETAKSEEIHELRVDSKRFRYVLEIFSRSVTWAADETLKRLVALQDELGAMHDDELLLLECQAAARSDLRWQDHEIRELNETIAQIENKLSERRLRLPQVWAFLFESGPEGPIRS